jgi:hypothetical protein
VDISKSLQATLHYYEHVANKETPERAAVIVWQTQKLRKIIARIENELESESAQQWGCAFRQYHHASNE